MPRLGQISRADAPAGVAAVYDAVFGGRDPVSEPGTATGSRGDWWTVMANVPELLAAFAGQFAVFNSPDRELPARWRELAITRVGFVTGSRFVYSQHSKVARAVGVSAEEVEAVRAWASSKAFGDDERRVLAYVDELVLQDGRVQDATFEALRTLLSDAAILELTVVAATYRLHATISRALRLEFDDVAEEIAEVPGPAGFRDEDLLRLLAGEPAS
ncbi:MAG: carboxymuconolactone decarboxylase family protein [Acidimicrobiia bacterium]